MRFAVLIFALAAIGCADTLKPECGDKFLLLWPTAAQGYKFQHVQIFSLKSPYEMKGDAAEVYYESGITDRGFSSPIARPRVTHSGDGLCVPMDTGSSMAIAAYAHFERLMYFDRDLQVADQVTWPRKVGVEIHLRGPDGQTHNNAHYFSKNDSIAVIPYNRGGVSLGLNPGVLAHEHFHAHFQTQVIAPLNSVGDDILTVDKLFYAGFGLKPTVDDLENSDPGTVSGLNKFVIRSWNEGLADFYAAIFSDDANFFYDSLPQLGGGRDLAGYLQLFKSADQLRADADRMGDNRQGIVGASYFQGTILARLMFRMATSGILPPKDFLRHIMRRLHRIPQYVEPVFNSRVMDFEEIVPELLGEIEPNTEACSALTATLSKGLLLRRYPQCRL